VGLAADAYARMLEALLPPGRLWPLASLTSLVHSLMLGSSDELARLDQRTIDLRNEADPRTAVETLPEYETDLELVAASTTAERQANVVGALVRRQRFRPVDIRTALAPLLGADPGDVTVIERSHALAVSLGDEREVFRFFVIGDPGNPGEFVASAQQLLDSMGPEHTAGYVIQSTGMACDDPFSLCDRDLLGA